MSMIKIQNQIVSTIKPVLNTKTGRRLISLWHTNINENLLRSYSQKGEDLIVDRLLGFKKNGFYVDVGANNPTACSNTNRFYLRGWRGINIEPNRRNLNLFKKARPKDTNLCTGIGAKKSKMIFYDFQEGALSTFSKEEAEKNIKMGKRMIGKQKVPIEKLSTILEKYAKGKSIDFMSVDTEGFDMEVLKSNDWKRFQPSTICIETAERGYKEDHAQEFLDYLKPFGYKIAARTRLNTIYERDVK